MMPDTSWFAELKWGVFCHYLAKPPLGVDPEAEKQTLTPEDWNRQVDAFDVRGLADQLEAVGAGYFFITLTQGSGFFCAPSEVYDRITGLKVSKCSKRDLISDLHAELKPRGIPLLVYCPSEFSYKDPEARPGLKLTHHHNDTVPPDRQVWRRHRQVEYMRNVEAIIRDFSNRWGPKVSGWWIDGCYEMEYRFPEDDPPNFQTLAAALRSGNPDAIVAFNTGVKTPVILNSVHEDYSAGEISRALPQCRGSTVELNGHHAQYHLLCFLGEFWGIGEPRFPDDLVTGYTRHVVGNGGVMTWEVPIRKNGLIPRTFTDQLFKLKSLSEITMKTQKKEETHART